VKKEKKKKKCAPQANGNKKRGEEGGRKGGHSKLKRPDTKSKNRPRAIKGEHQKNKEGVTRDRS